MCKLLRPFNIIEVQHGRYYKIFILSTKNIPVCRSEMKALYEILYFFSWSNPRLFQLSSPCHGPLPLHLSLGWPQGRPQVTLVFRVILFSPLAIISTIYMIVTSNSNFFSEFHNPLSKFLLNICTSVSKRHLKLKRAKAELWILLSSCLHLSSFFPFLGFDLGIQAPKYSSLLHPNPSSPSHIQCTRNLVDSTLWQQVSHMSTLIHGHQPSPRVSHHNALLGLCSSLPSGPPNPPMENSFSVVKLK